LLNQYPWYIRFLNKNAAVLTVSSNEGNIITFTPPLTPNSNDEAALDDEFDQVSLEMAGTRVYLLPAPSADPLTAVIHYCPNGKDCTSPCPQAPAPTSQKPPA